MTKKTIEQAYEELRQIIDGGSESFTHEDAVQYLKDKLAQPERREPTKQEHNILMGALKRSAKVVAQPEHDLYTDAEKDKPDAICDRNGQVALAMCKRCGKAEIELNAPCVEAQPEQEPVAYCDIHHLPEPCVQCAKEHEGYNIPPQPKETEQEPVATVVESQYEDGSPAGNLLEWSGRNEANDLPVGTKLYTDSPQRKPLTLVELSHIFASIPSVPFDGEWQLELARAIESAHGIKEKNT